MLRPVTGAVLGIGIVVVGEAAAVTPVLARRPRIVQRKSNKRSRLLWRLVPPKLFEAARTQVDGEEPKANVS